MAQLIVILLVLALVLVIRRRRRRKLGAEANPLTINPMISRDPSKRMARTKR